MAYYRTLDPSSPKAARPSKALPLARAGSSSELLKTFNPDFSGFGGAPLDLLVASPSLVRPSTKVAAHSCEMELPPGSFWRLNDALYIASPELCFVQMAQTMSAPQIAELGLNLCSIYYVDTKSRKLPERKPITTSAKLARFAERVTGLRGVKKAREALKWVVGGSRSPMESKMFLLLCYPRSRGGYGFPLAELNRRVNPGRDERLSEQEYYRIDVCWPDEFVGVEYFGEDDHENNVVRDRRRLDALAALGWNMVVVDKQRLYDPDAFDTAAIQVASHLGYRFRKGEGWRHARTALREELGL